MVQTNTLKCPHGKDIEIPLGAFGYECKAECDVPCSLAEDLEDEEEDTNVVHVAQPEKKEQGFDPMLVSLNSILCEITESLASALQSCETMSGFIASMGGK